MVRFLYLLRGLVIVNSILAIYFIFFSMKYWKFYFFFNAAIVLGYIWFNYIRIFVNKMRMKDYGESNEGYTVVVPCYNEEPKLLRAAVKSLLKTDNNDKEVIIVDDGSTNDIWRTISKLKRMDKRIRVFKFNKNMGKRFAHKKCVENAKYDFIVSIDSDTIVEKNAIRKLLAPFLDIKVGATTGNVLIKNEDKNILTRIQTGLYWVGLNIYKLGQSTQGNVVCCSGCISAYRRRHFLQIMKEYTTQTFLGNKCGASEDRYLTNLMNERGLKILYVESAICFTEAPYTIKKFIKQQIRWKRGFYRECLYTATYAWKKSKILYFENLIWLMLSPVISLPTILMTYYILISYPIHFLTITIPFTILFAICRDSLFFIEEPKRAIYYLPYIILYIFIMYPLNIYAIFNSNPEKWGTR